MPLPAEQGRHSVSELKPRVALRNEFGSQILPVYFHLPGPARDVPCDYWEAPFDIRFFLLTITYRVPGDSAITIHGAVGAGGPYTGAVHAKELNAQSFTPRGSLVNCTMVPGGGEGIVVCLYGAVLDEGVSPDSPVG